MQAVTSEDAIIARTPLRDEAYREILDRISKGALPPGTRVRDSELAVTLGVSRTPIREALLRLAREGVLTADMGRGFRVTPLDEVEMRETGAILATLECLALELSGDTPGERLAELSDIDQELAGIRGDPNRCIDLDEQWHRVLVQGCPNQRLLSMITSLWQVPRRYMRAYLRDAGRVSLSTQHHARIIEALRRNDRETAAGRFRHHWQRGIEELSAWIGR
ncbi:MAG TPA: GntR family transcriptional regulator [Gemmatimonadales bacterium]|nr:GntR family transcriptional regulator [Gemmatimonadales bacterium]